MEYTGHTNNYSKLILDSLNDLRNQHDFCDIIINVGGKSFQAHKNILGASSQYFLKMFTSGFKERSEIEVRIDGEPDIFGILLNYAYTGTLKMTPETAYDVLDMACYMGFIGAINCFYTIFKSNMCYKGPAYLLEKSKGAKKSKLSPSEETDLISVEDVYKIMHLARLASNGEGCLKEMAEDAEEYLCQHVKKLKTAQAFLQTADEDFFKSFLKRPTLPIKKGSESQILEMVVNWLKHDWDKRRNHAPNLLRMVRLGLVPTIDDVVGPEIMGSPECKVLFEELLVDLKQPSSDILLDLSQKPSQFHTSRSAIQAAVAFFSIEHSDIEDEHENSMEMWNEDDICGKWHLHYFDIDAKEWKFVSRFANIPEGGSMIIVEGKLYSIGGYKWSSVEFEEDWDAGSDLSDCEEVQHYRRMRSSLFGFSDDDGPYIYDDVHVSRKKFLCYSSKHNNWESLLSMNKARRGFPMVSLDGYIYVIGGYDQYRKLLIGDVERFSIAGNEWTSLPSLPEVFVWVSAITFGEKILAYGVSRSAKAATSEDPSKAARSEVPSEEKIPEKTRKHVLQMYDPSKNTWQCKYENDHTTRLKYGGKDGNFVASEAVLFLYKGSCYRVLYKWYKDPGVKESFGDKSSFTGFRRRPKKETGDRLLSAYSVAKIELTQEGDNVEVSIGESFSQDLMPISILGAFRIQDEVFINLKGSVIKTDLKISADQTTDVDLKSWHGLSTANMNQHSNVVFFAFDLQTLGYYKR